MHVLTLVAAVAGWAAIHSWLASVRVKRQARRSLGRPGERLYRLLYNVFSVVSLMPVLLLWRSMPDHALYAVPAPWSYVLAGGQALSVVLMLLAFLQTGPLAFAGIAQVLGQGTSSQLTITGFYGLVRHPLYLFGLAFLWLTPSMSVNQLAVSATLTGYLFAGAILEEQRLVGEFGAAYEDYRRTVPMIIPFTGSRQRAGMEH